MQTIQDEGVYETIEMTFVPERKLAANDYGLFAPTTKWYDTQMIAKENEDPPFMEREPVNKMDRQKQMRKIMHTTSTH